MIALNIDGHCLVYTKTRIDIQPALNGVEQAIMRAIHTTSGLNISALAMQLGASYANTYAMVYRLRYRGLLTISPGVSGSLLSSLAEWMEADE